MSFLSDLKCRCLPSAARWQLHVAKQWVIEVEKIDAIKPVTSNLAAACY